jgi:CDP-diacylglycerol---glycerol-3-phosphate 3-phosphatidyltransferase
MALNAYARSAMDRLILPVARSLVRAGATANWLTFAGLVGTVGGTAVVLSGRAQLGALILTGACLVDAFDGSVARLRGSASAFGSFYDSVTDRFSDAVIFGAAAWLVRDDPATFTAAIVALAAAQITSYVRAKAESLGWDATVGLVERPERLIIIICGIGLGLLSPALWLLAAGGLITIAQRFRAVLRQAPTT